MADAAFTQRDKEPPPMDRVYLGFHSPLSDTEQVFDKQPRHQFASAEREASLPCRSREAALAHERKRCSGDPRIVWTCPLS